MSKKSDVFSNAEEIIKSKIAEGKILVKPPLTKKK